MASILIFLLISYNYNEFGVKAEENEYENFFDSNKISTVDILVEDEEWNQLKMNAQDKEYIQCDINLNGKIIQGVGIRTKGTTSLCAVPTTETPERFSFKINFNKYNKNNSFLGLDKMVLNNIFQDPTYLKEYFVYDMFNIIGVPCSRYTFTVVYVNGEKYGFYLALESVDESFLKRNFGNDYGKLYKPDGSQDIDFEIPLDKLNQIDFKQIDFEKLGFDKTSLMKMITFMEKNRDDFSSIDGVSGADLVYIDDDIKSYSNLLNNNVTKINNEDSNRLINSLKEIKNNESIKDFIDVDMVSKYTIINSFVVNYDSYFGPMLHNYYLYEDNGILSLIPWDYNLAFSGFNTLVFNGVAIDKSGINDPIDTPVFGATLEERPIVNRILQNNNFLDEYHHLYSKFLNDYFESGYFEKKYNYIIDLIDKYIKEDNGFYTYEEYKLASQELKNYILLRVESVEKQLNGEIPSTIKEQQNNSSGFVSSDNIDLDLINDTKGLVSSLVQYSLLSMNDSIDVKQSNEDNEIAETKNDIKQSTVDDVTAKTNLDTKYLISFLIIVLVLIAIIIVLKDKRKAK